MNCPKCGSTRTRKKAIRNGKRRIYCNDCGKMSTIPLESKPVKNVLIIGDLHAPFIKAGYLEFCQRIYRKHKCNRVIFTGDLLDNHFSSYHETDPDGHSAAVELLKARKEIEYWHMAFPRAKVCLGNHDAIPYRKGMTAGLSSSWIKTIDEVLDVPGWEFSEEYLIDNVLYCHGIGRKANRRMAKDMVSVVQGHYHSESYIQYLVGNHRKTFSMQVGCGIDRRQYAMAYGRHFDKPHINCGVVLENGTLPILEYMDLK